jgi:hypothetical protein
MRIERRLGPIFYFYRGWNKGCCLNTSKLLELLLNLLNFLVVHDLVFVKKTIFHGKFSNSGMVLDLYYSRMSFSDVRYQPRSDGAGGIL